MDNLKIDGREVSSLNVELELGKESKTKIKKIKRKEFIKYKINKIINNSLDKVKEDIDELDKNIPGRKEGYLVTEDNKEMF
ncbi:MAG: hypothetical protein ACLVIU_04245 [Paraclostridium sp.]